MNSAPMAAIVIKLSMVNGLPQPERRKGTLRHRGHADQTGRDKGPFADLGRKIFDDPGCTQQKRGEDDQLALGRLIPALAPVGGVVMDMAGAAVTAVVALCGGRLRAVVVLGVIVALMCRIVMAVPVMGAGQHKILLRTGSARRNLIAKRPDGLLDLVPPGLRLIQRQPQAFCHDPDLDAAHPRKTRHRILDLGRAGPAVHARHGPVTGRFACSFRHRHSSCRSAGSCFHRIRNLMSLATIASRGI